MAVIDADDLVSAFSLPGQELGTAHPETIATRMMEDPEHKHLRENEIRIAYLFRHESKVKGGKCILGSVHEPTCQGELRNLFEWMLERLFGCMPDYVMILDKGFWDSVTPQTREALVYHELCHIKQKLDEYGAPKFNRQTGLPIYGLVAHDLEEFNAVAAKYGAWSPDIADFIAAARG
jgi:hypothetical protein